MSSLTMVNPKHRRVYSQGISYVAAATSLSPRFGPTEKESLASTCCLETWSYAVETGWDAGSGRSDWSDMYVGWMDQSH